LSGGEKSALHAIVCVEASFCQIQSHMNMNNMKMNYGEMGSFCKLLKIMKTIAYTFNNILLN